MNADDVKLVEVQRPWLRAYGTLQEAWVLRSADADTTAKLYQPVAAHIAQYDMQLVYEFGFAHRGFNCGRGYASWYADADYRNKIMADAEARFQWFRRHMVKLCEL